MNIKRCFALKETYSMVQRKKKSTKRKKTPASRRKKVTKTTARKSLKRKKAGSNNKAHWAAYKTLQKKIDVAWAKMKKDVKNKASVSVLTRDKNQLLLLLGECNYMARECKKCAKKTKKRR